MNYFSYRKNIFLFLLFLLFLLFSLHVKADNNLLRIGVSQDDAFPYYFKQNGKFVGFDIDLIKEIAHQLNLKTQFIDFPFSELNNALKKDKIDIVISLISETEERKKKYELSMPYICTYGTFLFRNAKIRNEFENDNRANKNPLNIGVKENTRYHNYALSNLATKNIKINTQISHNLVFGAFEAQKIDIILSEDFLVKSYANRHKSAAYIIGNQVFLEKLVIVAKKGNSDLINKINVILQRMIYDGYLQSLSNKHLKLNMLCK